MALASAVVVTASMVVMRLEIAQLAPLAIAAVVYAGTQEVSRCRKRRSGAEVVVTPTATDQPQQQQKQPQSGNKSTTRSPVPGPRDAKSGGAKPPGPPKMELRQDSKVPVPTPNFVATCFDSQVEELLALITPTPESDRVAQRLAACAKKAIQQIFPEVDVAGFTSGDVVRGTAFGVAVPELELVASASPHALVQHLQGRLSKGGQSLARLDPRKLQKSAIRVCTDQLVSAGGFKFRRSAFRGQEPKVTLMAPPLSGGSDKSIPVDFSVNCPTPLYNAALMAECLQIDARSKALVLIVRRWAKDRGICHAAKGHLPPYAWTLLTIYFLQVGVQVSSLMPPLQGFKMVNRMIVRRGGTEADEAKGKRRWVPPEGGSAATKLTVAELFKGFLRFYGEELDWQKEAVAVRLGDRAAASLDSVIHPTAKEDKKGAEAGAAVPDSPAIEDPFEPSRNLGACMTSMGLQRLREELVRANDIINNAGTLSSLLELWAPLHSVDEEEGEGDDGEDPRAEVAAFSVVGGSGGTTASSVAIASCAQSKTFLPPLLRSRKAGTAAAAKASALAGTAATVVASR